MNTPLTAALSPGAAAADQEAVLRQFIEALGLPEDSGAELVVKKLSCVRDVRAWARLDGKLKCHSRVLFRTLQTKYLKNRPSEAVLAQIKAEYISAVAVDGRNFSFSLFLNKIAALFPQYSRQRLSQAVLKIHTYYVQEQLLSTARLIEVTNAPKLAQKSSYYSDFLNVLPCQNKHPGFPRASKLTPHERIFVPGEKEANFVVSQPSYESYDSDYIPTADTSE